MNRYKGQFIKGNISWNKGLTKEIDNQKIILDFLNVEGIENGC